MQISFNDMKSNVVIIDIRATNEYEEFHYPNSVCIPRLTLLKCPDEYLNKVDEYYLICHKGEVSLSCSRILNALGYHCYSVEGGIEKYKNSIKI
ncbi:MAG: rhodanese-like domain-containing protein [Bacilli bacterium]|nr:rhodanese-like domain-containing protein [Bacilli bacterium]